MISANFAEAESTFAGTLNDLTRNEIQRRIAQALETLPTANPFTLSSREALESDGETNVRRLVLRACEGFDPSYAQRMSDEYFGAGPIEPYFDDATVTEIILNGPDSIWIERNGRLEQVPDRFLSALTYRNFISRMSREGGFQASLDCPFADGHWRGSRVHLIIPPASGEHVVVTLRRHAAVPWTLDELNKKNWARQGAMDSLRQLIETRANFLIIGCTGSGKTSVLNACLAALGDSERALLIEDTSELTVPNRVSSKLLTRRDPQRLLRDVDQGELLKQALRMRPDRIVMGEIRSGEAKDLLMAFATGHSGCMGTLHADSARQALLRLEMLVQLGAPQWNLQAVRSLIWLSLQAIVVVGKTTDGARRLEGIYKIASLEDVGFLLEKIV